MSTPKFTTDNTKGYSHADLMRLNELYEVAVAELRADGIDVDNKDDIGILSLLVHLAERVEADFSNQVTFRELP